MTSRTIHGLVCRRDVLLAVRCLGSLVRRCASSVDLIIHDDGSLNAEAIDILRQGIGAFTLIKRAEADDRVVEALQEYPNCLRFRSENVLGLKLFDVMLLSTEQRVHFCDSDVLFIRNFDFNDFTRSRTDAVFMVDGYNSYSVRSWQMLARGIKMPARVNTGLFAVSRCLFDLDRLEWFFAKDVKPILRQWWEQTAWAVLAAGGRTGYWDPSQARLVLPESSVPGKLICGHFVGTYRKLLEEFNEGKIDDETLPIGVVELFSCTPWSMLREELGRALRRRLRWKTTDPYQSLLVRRPISDA